MEEIEYVAGSPFFVNGSGNPYDMDSPLNRLQRLIERGYFSEESPEFIYYLDRMAEEMVTSYSSKYGPDPMRTLPVKLFFDLDNGSDMEDEKYEFYVFYLLCRVHEELGDYQGMRKLVKRLEAEFDHHPYFGKIKSRALSHSKLADERQESIEAAFLCSSRFSEYPDLKRNLAETIVTCTEDDTVYSGSMPAIPKDEVKIIEMAEQSIQDAKSGDNYPAEYTLLHAKVKAIKEDYQSAEELVSSAVEELSRDREQYLELRADFGFLRDKIISEGHKREIEDRTSELSDSLSTLDEKLSVSSDEIDNLDQEVEGIYQDFQNTMIEFLGFFSAIIAAVVITGQIALNIGDPQAAGRLFLISYGGLLFAFGGFATVLRSNNSDRIIRGGIAVIGLAVAVFALHPQRVSDAVVGVIP
ncbi:hypothetical protein GOC83_18810 [Haloarcula rubripromontorii]|uniref:Uncharacterized protein n=1 Tax=Haloarcula rubripromontorii TaxID=1705562 RepID=A0A847UAP9_9EURY|nr:hypothetical protein [Haloarcula rubripromontorii]NLV08178.1 hypothetical protein [Haloarcula rubripromontorii]